MQEARLVEAREQLAALLRRRIVHPQRGRDLRLDHRHARGAQRATARPATRTAPRDGRRPGRRRSTRARARSARRTPARSSRPCSRARAPARAGSACPCRRSAPRAPRPHPPSAAQRGRLRPVAPALAPPERQRRDAAVRRCPPAAAAPAAARGRACTRAARPGPVRPVDVELDHRRVERLVREAVQRHDLERQPRQARRPAGRRHPHRPPPAPPPTARCPAWARRASRAPAPCSARAARRPRRDRPPGGRWSNRRDGAGCRPGAAASRPLTAQGRRSLERRREVRLHDVVEDQPPALGEELDRVAPHDAIDVVVVDAASSSRPRSCAPSTDR